MRRATLLLLVLVGLSFAAQSALATTIAVGTCRPALPHYATISAAVAIAPAGATVLVCPGTYSEQVVISTPLTLEGISAGNADRPVISASSGLSANVTNILGAAVAAQVLVEAGPVNLSSITVDGAGNGLAGSGTHPAGIFYASGSSGIVNGVTVRNEIAASDGAGIWIENGSPTSEAVTVENCSVHDFDSYGIIAISILSPPSLTATIKGNRVTDLLGIFGINIYAAGSVTGNVLTGPGSSLPLSLGITGNSTGSTVSGNTITNWIYGMTNFGDESFVSNAVTDSAVGFGVGASPVVVQKNNFANDSFAGVDFFCFTGTVSSNTITDTPTALNDVPLSFTLMPNTYQNVDAIRSAGTCTAAKTTAGPSAIPRPIPVGGGTLPN
jgi:hypothetical protein